VLPEVGAAWEGGESRCGQVVVLKLPHYGGPYRLSEGVSLFRPGLEVVGVGGGRLAVLRLFWSAFAGRPGPLPGAFRSPAEEVTLDLPPHGRYQADGDPFRARRVRVWSDPAPIAVVARPGR
jgi:diacylglycerol kinase family enzyme